MPAFIYLASQSPRRAQLLEQMGVAHRPLLPNAEGDVAEDAEAIEVVHPGEAPARYVQRVTAGKLNAAIARLARRRLPGAPILCADTTVALGRRILGKPADAAEARDMLQSLSGTTHRVLTAVALQHGSQRMAALSTSQVRFDTLSSAQIDDYVASGEPFGKAGGYGIQGQAAMLISRIAGSYSGIMGLPVYETSALLRAVGFLR
jgi:septum formation protein